MIFYSGRGIGITILKNSYKMSSKKNMLVKILKSIILMYDKNDCDVWLKNIIIY